MVTSLTWLQPDTPAILGGRPLFPRGLPLVRPTIPDRSSLAERIEGILDSGTLTNGPTVRELERRAAEYLGVKHALAVGSCTAGLMLALRAAGLSGDVVVPSFTFAATVHAVAWNGLRPVFADIDPETLTLSADAVRHAVTVRTSAVLATHVYGTPCDVEGLAAIAEEFGCRLFFDAAHAFGSRRAGMPVGRFGDAEIFSLSPTKVLVAGEGGIVATNDDLLAERCAIGRDYGHPGDYDCRFVGLNGRMSELHAAVALASFSTLEERIERRGELVRLYRGELGAIPGLSFPAVRDGDRSTYKDFTVLVEPSRFGLDAGGLATALAAEGIETRRYYWPPVHAMRAYRGLGATAPGLRVTDDVGPRVITLPLWDAMSDEDVLRSAAAIARIHTALGHPLHGRRLLEAAGIAWGEA
jgi:dTDP-4-amino-4,6-dideoxygalactose transaminase